MCPAASYYRVPLRDGILIHVFLRSESYDESL